MIDQHMTPIHNKFKDDISFKINEALVDLSSKVTIPEDNIYHLLFGAREEIKYLRNHINSLASCDRVTSTQMQNLLYKSSELVKYWNQVDALYKSTENQQIWISGKDE